MSPRLLPIEEAWAVLPLCLNTQLGFGSHCKMLLHRYTCLTVGDAICVYYNNRKYFIDVVEAKPAAAISVIDTDCEVPASHRHVACYALPASCKLLCK